MQNYTATLRELLDRCTPLLLSLSPELTIFRPAPDKWSRQEILGHLIDSASNNHRRFVEGQFRDDLVVVGYDQDAWVRSQPYQRSPGADLVALWQGLNWHLVRVMESVPDSTRIRPRPKHNLAEIGWKVSPTDPATLDFIMHDYVVHLQHHLRQILGPVVDQIVADATPADSPGSE